MTCCAPEIHVGDTSKWHVEVTDLCQPFNPVGASVTQLIFKMPNGIILRKDATVTTEGSPTDSWFFDYQIQPGDGLGSPGEFFDNPGPVQVQAYIEYPDGSRFHSDIKTTDINDLELFVFPNLD